MRKDKLCEVIAFRMHLFTVSYVIFSRNLNCQLHLGQVGISMIIYLVMKYRVHLFLTLLFDFLDAVSFVVNKQQQTSLRQRLGAISANKSDRVG